MADHAPVPYLAPAVQRGFGFFETALLVGRRAVLWDAHLDRLLRGLRRLELPAPTRDAMDAAARLALDAAAPESPLQSGLRLTWLAAADDVEDASSWRLDAYVIPIPESRLARRDGSHAVSLPLELQRDTPAVKSTSYFAAIQGGRLAKKAGADEGLFRRPRRTLPRGHDDRPRRLERRDARPRAGGRSPERHGRGLLRRTGRRRPDYRRAASGGRHPPRLAHDGGAARRPRRDALRAAPGDARADPRIPRAAARGPVALARPLAAAAGRTKLAR